METVLRLFELGDDLEKRRAALVLAEHRDARGLDRLVSWWKKDSREHLSPIEEAALLAVFGKAHERSATDALLVSFLAAAGHPQRRRPLLDALLETGDPTLVGPILSAFEHERYIDLREREAQVLYVLGAGARLLPPLRRFAGMPDGRLAYLDIAEKLGALTPASGGIARAGDATLPPSFTLRPSSKRPQRLLVERTETARLALTIDGRSFPSDPSRFFSISVGPVAVGEVHAEGVRRAWLVDAEDELPPPPKERWDAGAE